MGGIDNSVGSGAIIFAFRDYILKNKKDILLSYDRIILSRSDYYYIMDHPILPLGKLYVTEGEGYYGITDRHHVFDSKFSEDVLGVCDFMCDRNNFEFLKTQDSINPEKALLLYFQHNKVNNIIEECERVQFVVSTESDATRWGKPTNYVEGSDKIKYKYPKEYEIAIKNKTNKKNIPQMIEITYLSDDKKNIHFVNKLYTEQKVEILVHEGFEDNLINVFNIDLQPQLQYWVSINEGFGEKKIVFRDRITKEILLEKDYKKKIVLIQLWFGKIPDYFWHHYETTKNLRNVDFLFVTDQDLNLDAPNYKVLKTNIDTVVNKVSDLLGSKIQLKSNKKTCDLKASLGDVFAEHIMDYEYFGCYDIDTLFGDVEKYVHPLLGEYDIISVGHEKFHNRLSGPFLIMKNTQELRTFYRTNEFIKCFESADVECYEENVMDRLVKDKFTVKLISSMNTSSSGKNIYDCTWTGGKNFINGEEIFLYHFYRKNSTTFTKFGNKIYARYNKELLEDFYWTVGFTENYTNTILFLLDSIKKFSNRKCLIYTINFDFVLPEHFVSSEQFILRRIDIQPGEKDSRGRDQSILNLKPNLMIDAINTYPSKKFVFVDSDIYLTTNCDSISRYFEDLDYYPLINSHVHDVIYMGGYKDYYNEDWVSSLHILLNEMGINETWRTTPEYGNKVEPVYPRRKTNIIVFDSRSKWFFEEQIEIYEKYKDNTAPGILSLHDEDVANVILSKYNLKNSLPLLDIEENYNLDVNSMHNYSYSITTNISPSVVLPKTINDFICFHGFKHTNDYNKIMSEYGMSTLDCEEFFVKYDGKTLVFEKNSFLKDKTISNLVNFRVYDLKNNLLSELTDQEINRYWIFYIGNLELKDERIIVKIDETDTGKIIYHDVIKLK
jgi:hypothetical protein